MVWYDNSYRAIIERCRQALLPFPLYIPQRYPACYLLRPHLSISPIFPGWAKTRPMAAIRPPISWTPRQRNWCRARTWPFVCFGSGSCICRFRDRWELSCRDGSRRVRSFRRCSQRIAWMHRGNKPKCDCLNGSRLGICLFDDSGRGGREEEGKNWGAIGILSILGHGCDSCCLLEFLWTTIRHARGLIFNNGLQRYCFMMLSCYKPSNLLFPI